LKNPTRRQKLAGNEKLPGRACFCRCVRVRGFSVDARARFDVVNLFDKIYELRDGRGIGVGAPQFGQRRGFYGTIAYDF